MSFNYNHVVLMGRVTKDLEITQVGETKKTTFTLAVDRNYRKEDGSSDTDFIWVTIWGKLAEVAAQYLTKGRPVLVDGRIQVRSYKKDTQVRWYTEVIANHFRLLDSPASSKDATEFSQSQEAMMDAIPN